MTFARGLVPIAVPALLFMPPVVVHPDRARVASIAVDIKIFFMGLIL